MGKGGGDGGRPPWGERYCVSSTRIPPCRPPVPFGGNVTSTDGGNATDGSQASASQSQNPAGSSIGVEGIPRLPGQAKKLTTPGVPNPDSEALGCLNEGSEKALDVQLHEALLHGHRREDPERAAEVSRPVTQDLIAVLLRWVRSLDYNLRQKLCEYILPNGEKAGKSSSKGTLAESSDAPYAKRKKPWLSTNFPGVRERNNKFGSHIRRRFPREDIWLGTYKTAEAAAQARAAAAN
ncbi:unnamed protein product [Sphagnum troendelagicum]|uniref:AP2/ERF domain-containing protein n=1 Tax=Sphagnum troendelagicum TaxID=128251 RepID=A0ABP0UTR5_9BRYO